ncbi:MAG: hypothetical protein KJP00_13585 [Bacteroidia bacterium]|nr:hypothetical protein [Bacteroidia bacterium]
MKIEFELPYYEIPDYPEHYSACTVVARMADGLGFRYYWATEGLRDEDLKYKPSEDARTTSETIDHLLGLSEFILNSALQRSNTRREQGEMSFTEKRTKTLFNIKRVADIMRSCNDLSKYKIVTERGENITEYPFWNQINGPIADALWHCGQVVSFRRSSGNPYNSKASVFTGKVRE